SGSYSLLRHVRDKANKLNGARQYGCRQANRSPSSEARSEGGSPSRSKRADGYFGRPGSKVSCRTSDNSAGTHRFALGSWIADPMEDGTSSECGRVIRPKLNTDSITRGVRVRCSFSIASAKASGSE